MTVNRVTSVDPRDGVSCTAGTVRVASPLAVSSRLPALDGIRGVAIVLVLIWHFVATGNSSVVPGTVWGYIVKSLHHTYSGVDLFFVLSGFLISRILLGSLWSDRGLRVFWIRRVFRIIPLYALFLALSCMLVWMSPFLGLKFEMPKTIWPYFVSLQNFEMVHAGTLGPWGLTWSLGLEEQYYLLLPFLMLAFGRRVFVPLMLASIFASSFLRWCNPGFSAFVLLPYRLDGFAAGGILAWASVNASVMDKLRRHAWVPWGLFSIGVILLGIITIRESERFPPVDHSVFAFSYASLILVCLTTQDNLVTRVMCQSWLRRLGVISYPLYLFHEIVRKILVDSVFSGVDAWWARWGMVVAATCGSIATAEVLHRAVGEPLLKVGHRLSAEISKAQYAVMEAAETSATVGGHDSSHGPECIETDGVTSLNVVPGENA